MSFLRAAATSASAACSGESKVAWLGAAASAGAGAAPKANPMPAATASDMAICRKAAPRLLRFFSVISVLASSARRRRAQAPAPGRAFMAASPRRRGVPQHGVPPREASRHGVLRHGALRHGALRREAR